MIPKYMAGRIFDLCSQFKQLQGGTAACLGDQQPTFSAEWASQAKQAWKNWKGITRIPDNGPLTTADSFFKLCGFKDYFSVDYNGSGTINHDFGKPIPTNLHESADFIYEGGVVEHIPNIYQAMSNVMIMLKKGGIYAVLVPVNVFGDCLWENYWNINPIVYTEFFGANGFETIQCNIYAYWTWKLWAAGAVRRWAPECVVNAFKNKNAADTVQTGGRGWIQNALNCDNPDELVLLDPFDKKTQQRIFHTGLPPRSHVLYIGRKTRHIVPGSIIDSVPKNYPKSA